MSSTFFGVTGGGGGGASSVFFFGIAYGPTLSVGPPASAGTSCLGLPLSWVCDGFWVGWCLAVWSCASDRQGTADERPRQTTGASGEIRLRQGNALSCNVFWSVD